MWVIKVSDFLDMDFPLPQHEECLAAGLLHRANKSVWCIFVSHQWLGKRHPDPGGHQFKVLQDALRNVIAGTTKVSRDIASEFYGDSHSMSDEDRGRLRNAYLWLDWLSVPQHRVAVDQVSDLPDSMLSHRAVLEKRGRLTTQDVHILSIPDYVQYSDVFLALTPVLPHNDTGERCNYCSWFERGWCRMEMWCKMLSEKASSASMPMIVVSAPDRVTLETPLHWTDRPPHEGRVTFEANRAVIFSIMKHLLQQRLKFLAMQNKKDSYYYLLAKYETMLGLPRCERSLSDFLVYFGFGSNLASAKKCNRNIGPMACAVISGDWAIIPKLHENGFSVNIHLKPMIDVRIMSSLTLVHLAVDVSWRQPKVLETLLKLKADPNSTDDVGYPVLGFCRTQRDVELLVASRADVNLRNAPSKQLAISVACEYCQPPEVISKLLACGSLIDPPDNGGLGCPHPLAFLSIWATANPDVLEVAQMLISARADVNQQCVASGYWRALEMASRAYLQVCDSSSTLVHYFAEWSTTPLGMACFFGSEELVDLLLTARADPHRRNRRGHTPIQLAQTQRVLEVIDARLAHSQADRSSCSAFSV